MGGVTPTTQLPSFTHHRKRQILIIDLLQKEKQITGTPAHPLRSFTRGCPSSTQLRAFLLRRPIDQASSSFHHTLFYLYLFPYLFNEGKFTLSLNLSDLASHFDLSNYLRQNSTKTLGRRSDHKERRYGVPHPPLLDFIHRNFYLIRPTSNRIRRLLSHLPGPR